MPGYPPNNQNNRNLQIQQQAFPINANADGLAIRALLNTFISSERDFMQFCVQNPHLVASIQIVKHLDHGNGEVIWRILINDQIRPRV